MTETLSHPTAETPPVPDWPMPRSCPMLPPDAYAELRERPPSKVRLRDGEAWLITRYQDVRQALADPRLSSDDQRPNFPLRIQLPPEPRIQSFFRMDQPEQGRLRRMAMTEFTARRTKLMRPAVEQLVADLLDELAAQPKPADLVEHFTLKLPSLVIARMLGVPDSDEMTFTAQSRMILSQEATPEQTYGAYLEMSQYLDQLTAKREQDPQDDLLSRLAVQYVATGQLTHDDLVAMARFFLIAGHETTANQLALSVVSLLENPDQLALLRERPELIHSAIEELLRYWSISQDNIVRLAIEDFDLGGAPIRSGDPVVIALNGANHDEEFFPGAAKLDLTRDARHHVAFGHGPHLCPGAPLARLEMEEGLSELLRRFPDLRLAVDVSELEFRQNTLVYGINRLPVTW